MLAEQEPSTRQAATTAQLVSRTLAMLQKHSIAVNSRHYGITVSFVNTYIMIHQQHDSPSTDSAELEDSMMQLYLRLLS